MPCISTDVDMADADGFALAPTQPYAHEDYIPEELSLSQTSQILRDLQRSPLTYQPPVLPQQHPGAMTFNNCVVNINYRQ